MAKTVFMFPGQGAQYTGMGKEIYDISAAAKSVFNAFEKKRKGTIEQCFEASKEELTLTVNSQPCILAVELATAAALEEKGVKTDAVCGFSLGELAAVCYSGMLSLEKIIDLVIFRAEQMDICCQNSSGAMAAVMKTEPSVVEAVCKKYDKACIANYNSDSQVTISCAATDMDKIEAELKNAGAMVVRLSVSGAFHSEFMTPAAKNMEKYLAKTELKKAKIECYSNVNAEVFDDKSLIAKQINNPVMWNGIINNLLSSGADTFIEIGPGNVLTGLLKRKIKTVNAISVNDKASLGSINN